MSRGSFNGVLSPYTYDHAATELQRRHRERLAREAREERATAWVADRLVGRTFLSYESLAAAGCAAFSTLRGRELTPDEHELMTRAARILWSGLAFRATLAAVRVETVRVGASLTFTRAA